MIDVLIWIVSICIIGLSIYFATSRSDSRSIIAASIAMAFLSVGYAILDLYIIALVQLGLVAGLITVILLTSAGIGLDEPITLHAHAAILSLVMLLLLVLTIPLLSRSIAPTYPLINPVSETFMYMLLLQGIVVLAAAFGIKKVLEGDED